MDGQSMLDDYYGPLVLKFKFTPWKVKEIPQTHITDYFRTSEPRDNLMDEDRPHVPPVRVVPTAERDDEKSLLHDLSDDLDDLLTDANAMTSKNYPSFNLMQSMKNSKVDEERAERKKPKKKAKKNDFDSDSDEKAEKEDKSTSDAERVAKKKKKEEVESNGEEEGSQNEKPKKRRKLKRFSEKIERPVEESDDLDILPDAPTLDERQEKKKEKDLAAALFASDEDSTGTNEAALLEAGKKKVAVLNLSGNDDNLFQLINIEEDTLERDLGIRKQSSLDEKITLNLTRDGIPIEVGKCDIATIRCVYAANPKTEGWTPIDVDAIDDEKMKNREYTLAMNEQEICNSMWGVFTVHGLGDQAAGGGRRRGGVTFVEESAAEHIFEMNRVPWFIVLGNEELLRVMVSPFFTYKVRAIRVDSVRVKFGWRQCVPIFYVYGLDEKLPLWPEDANWQPTQLVRIMCDTLYAHVELECKRSGPDVEACVRKVLSNIESFPMTVTKPWETVMTPNAVPMNNYSTRADRSSHLKKFIVTPYKTKTVSMTPSSSADTWPLIECVSTLVTPADYLLTDLEKPSQVWGQVVGKFGIPIEVVSGICNWQRDRGDVVSSRMLVFDQLVKLNTANKNDPLDMRSLQQLHTHLAFGPEWFDGWFGFARTPSDRSERLKLYAFFCASALWRQTKEESNRFGSLSTYLLTKAKRDYFFDSDLIWIDENRAISEKLSGTPTRNQVASEPLTTDECSELMQNIIIHFKSFNAAEKPPPFVIHGDPYGRITNIAAIHAERYKTSTNLASFILQVCTLFNNVRGQIVSPVLRSLPPLVVQCSSTFGKHSGNSTEEFYGALQTAFTSGVKMLILHPNANAAEFMMKLDAKEQPHVVVFDSFHNWTLQQISVVLTFLKKGAFAARCTHIIVTGYAHTLGFINGGGSMIWELMDIASRIDSLMGFETSNPDPTSNGIISALFNAGGANRYTRGAYTGLDLGDETYSILDRRAQLEANKEIFLFKQSGKPDDVVKLVMVRLESRKDRHVAFLYSRIVTMKRLKMLAASANNNLARAKPTVVHYYSYHAIELNPLLLSRVDSIILADLEYEGAGRINYMHINAAIEYAQHAIFLLRDTPATEGISFLLDELFMRNDKKSERYLMNISRCPILREHFFGYLDKEKVRTMLTSNAKTKPKTKAIEAKANDDD